MGRQKVLNKVKGFTPREGIKLISRARPRKSVGGVPPREQLLRDHSDVLTLGQHPEDQIVIFGPAVFVIAEGLQGRGLEHQAWMSDWTFDPCLGAEIFFVLDSVQPGLVASPARGHVSSREASHVTAYGTPARVLLQSRDLECQTFLMHPVVSVHPGGLGRSTVTHPRVQSGYDPLVLFRNEVDPRVPDGCVLKNLRAGVSGSVVDRPAPPPFLGLSAQAFKAGRECRLGVEDRHKNVDLGSLHGVFD